MPEVLAGTQPGFVVADVVAICADLFGYPPSSTKFSNTIIRAFNRALLDIWREHPTLRRFTVHDAPVTLQAGVDVYDVRQDVENGGFGWEKCFEVLDVFFGADRIVPLEKITLENWRFRQPHYTHVGVPEGIVILDGQRIRVFPTPDSAYVGTGDYYQEVPYITEGRVDWPAGWDQVALLGAEFYGARNYRADLVSQFRADYEKALMQMRNTDESRAVRPMRAVSTRRTAHRRFLPHDNSTDRRGFW